MSNLVLGILTLAVPAIAIGAYAFLFPGVVGRRGLRDDVFISYLRESTREFPRFDLSGALRTQDLLSARVSPDVLHRVLEETFHLMLMKATLRDRREEPGEAFAWWQRGDEYPVEWQFRGRGRAEYLQGDIPTPDDLLRRDEIAAALLAAVRDVHTSSESLELPRQIARGIAEQSCRRLEESDPLAFAFMAQVLARFLHERSERERRFKGRPPASE